MQGTQDWLLAKYGRNPSLVFPPTRLREGGSAVHFGGGRKMTSFISITTSVPAAASPAATALPIPRLRHHLGPSPSRLPPRPLPASSEAFPCNIPCAPSLGRHPLHAVGLRPIPSAAADPAASTASAVQPEPISVLFVCLGNICRSPAAEGVFRSLVSKKGLDAYFKIDSAGTIDYHEGDPADKRMRAVSKRRGIDITSISRPIRPLDFKEFDLILAMDLQNKDDILAAYDRWRFRDPLPEDAFKKVKLICSYCKKHKETEVPDPYYGGPQGFEMVLDLLEDACGSLLDTILAENSHISGL